MNTADRNNSSQGTPQFTRGRQLVESFLDYFIRRFGESCREPYRLMAEHAALPIVLTPELLNCLHGQFLRGEVDWEAGADLLLSELCREIGYEQYAMDRDARAYLLAGMTGRLGEQRMQDVARLLFGYVDYIARTNPHAELRSLQTQQWAVMFYLDDQRDSAINSIAQAIYDHLFPQDAGAEGTGADESRAEIERMTRLVEDYAQLLTQPEYAPFLQWARMAGQILKGTAAKIPDQMQQQEIFSQGVKVASVALPGLTVLMTARQKSASAYESGIRSFHSLIEEANTLFKEGKTAEAELLTQRIASLTPPDSKDWEGLAEMLQKGASVEVSIDLMLAVLRSDSEYARKSVVEALGSIGSPEAMAALIYALHDKSSLVRRSVVDALSKFGDNEAIAALRAVLQDPDDEVRRRALTALAQIEGVVDYDLEEFEFDTVTLDARGKVIERDTKQARQFIEEPAPGLTLEMVEIPGGIFMMGTADSDVEQARKEYRRYWGKDSAADWVKPETPQHDVTVSPFYIGKFNVTQAQWRIVAAWEKIERDLEPDPSGFKGANRPVESVSWFDAVEFCARLAKKAGRAYRLPSEAEWEYACRAGTTTPFAFGETITPEFVNYNGEYPYGKAKKGKNRGETVPVGSLGVANAFGLFDLHGNVWEWCQDWYGTYPSEPQTDPAGQEKGGSRVLRGGSSYDFGLVGVLCRSAFRLNLRPDDRNDGFGFRVVVPAWTK